MIPRTTTSKHYPWFIREHKQLARTKRKSIFPAIGLDNCSEEITKGRYKGSRIVFSSAGNKGLWDIATMSMRGISSCQRWDYDNGYSHERKLVGSMLDPYCGIIYITTGTKTKLGEKMTKRAVVRFVIDGNKPYLFIERVYGIRYNNNRERYDAGLQRYIEPTYENTEKNISDIFVAFLKSKTENKFEVEYKTTITTATRKVAIPQFPRLPEHEYQSYRDSGISYTNRVFHSPAAVLKLIKS